MPQPSLTQNERRLAALCRVLAALYLAAALAFALSPKAFAAGAGFTAALALAMMTAVATACLVTAARPRERRHAALCVIVAQLTVVAAAAVLFAGGARSPALVWAIAIGLPLAAITAAAYRAAAPGVHSAPARELAPPALEEPAPKIQLKVSKS